MADDEGVVVVKKGDFQFALESSKKRLQKEVGTKEKIARGENSLDFYNLRPTLEREQVVGAKANAICLSIAETAQSNGVDFYKYIKILLTVLPNIGLHINPEIINQYMP